MISVILKKKRFSDGFGVFFPQKDFRFFMFYVLLYAVFSLNIMSKDILLVAITMMFMIASLKCSLIMYLFFTLWENVAVFSFGIVLSPILKVLLFLKIIIYYSANGKTMFFNRSDLFFCLIAFFYGAINFFVGTGELSGIALGFDVFIALYAFSIYRNEQESTDFWKTVFFTIMLSTFFATCYGFFYDTALDRWISGLGRVKQLYGTVGTTRMGLYYCVSLIYPIFYIKKRSIKLALCALLSLFSFMTLSLTTLICFAVFWSIVMLYKNRSNMMKNASKYCLAILIACIVITLFWGQIRNVSFMVPMATRIENLMTALAEGDMSTATTRRSDLTEVYLNRFKESNIFNKAIGSFYINASSIIDVDRYSHNTYIDILLYTGIIGMIMFLLKILRRVWLLKRREEFLPVVLLKVMFFLTGLTVSMLTNSYWFVWMIL